jgi:hypothetical protein
MVTALIKLDILSYNCIMDFVLGEDSLFFGVGSSLG